MIIEKTLECADELLKYRITEIEKLAVNKGSFSITVKYEQGAESGDIQVRTKLNLIPERIRDEIIGVISTKQLPLGLGDGEVKRYNMGGK